MFIVWLELGTFNVYFKFISKTKMSSYFYFRKWKKTLVELEAIVNLDVHLQVPTPTP